ncbi:threonine synthase [Halalkaliarchaeum desulfuricum]|uniref:Threonine synthase n=1 Tax=Halalkaliarchaeum desulfuricum TaxID=2055893 RepID=A0A343THD1_9EURY|nr:pyridoxal-phosphate dependent enzyme [Halalkaliarchaeum desulfuricum]AUX08503.1 threonine synthase [Halalkaliarchaeum desulfuricum]
MSGDSSESGSGPSTPRSLICPVCGTRYPDRWRCRCGSPLRFDWEPTGLSDEPPDSGGFDTGSGLWSFTELLPIGDDPRDRVSLGEGMTPLVDADRQPPQTGTDRPAWNADFKLEYVFPTGSFKDRGATTILTRARELGVDRVVEDSSGNAGAAIATYAARAGIDAEIFVPAATKQSKLRAIERAGATTVRVEGTRSDVTDACIRAVESGDAWYASHAYDPAFFEGAATFAYEVALQRDWNVPDAVVTPLGHGTLFLGAYLGFKRLEAAGWIDRLPRLLGAQAAGVAPVVRKRHGEGAAEPDDGEHNDVADGIQISEPVQLDRILEAIDETDGDAIAITRSATEQELDRLHAAGFYTEPTCAVAPAALREYRRRGVVAPDDDVVVPLTGSGLKT